MENLRIEPDWIQLDLQAQTDEEAIRDLALVLYQEGVVKESYIQAVLEREKDFSTGLQIEGIGVAIPHTDSDHVLVQGVGIGILKNPVKFKEMGNPDNEVDVSVMIMLAIREPQQQLDFLQALMSLFQDSSKLIELTKCQTQEEASDMFKSYF